MHTAIPVPYAPGMVWHLCGRAIGMQDSRGKPREIFAKYPEESDSRDDSIPLSGW